MCVVSLSRHCLRAKYLTLSDWTWFQDENARSGLERLVPTSYNIAPVCDLLEGIVSEECRLGRKCFFSYLYLPVYVICFGLNAWHLY